MAWYALYKWYSPWSKRNCPDMIYWYKEYVLKTPEQRERESEQRKRDAQTAMAKLCAMHAILGSLPNKY